MQKNSSKPPSADPDGTKKNRRTRMGNKPGGQKRHEGQTLDRVDDPDEIKALTVDRTTLPNDGIFHVTGYEWRQVFDIDIAKFVIEYRAEMLEDEKGNRYVATFPDSASAPVQYGVGVKANAVYMIYVNGFTE